MSRSRGQSVGASRQLALLDHAERVAGLGSWEWVPESGELLWSDNHFRLFDLEPQSLVPSLEFLMAHVHPDDRERMEETLAALVTGEPRGVEYRIILDDHSVRWLRATVASVDEGAGRPLRLVGSVQDMTLQRGLDRQLAAHMAVSAALNDWGSLEHGAAALLDELGDALDMALGALWVRDGRSLAARVVRTRGAGDLVHGVAGAMTGHRVGIGAPVVGVAYATRQPLVSTDPGRPAARREACRAAGIKGALAIPAVHARETLAVLEFLSREPITASQRLLRTASGIGHELGHFLSHRRGEIGGTGLSPREREVLQLAAHGTSASAIAEQLGLSPATVKRHFEQAYARLEVCDRASAVAEAMRRGWIT